MIRTLTFVTVDFGALPSSLLEPAKAHMRVDHCNDDIYIKNCLARSIDYFERTMDVTVNPSTILWKPIAGDFCDGMAQTPIRPVPAFTATAVPGDVTANYSVIQKYLYGAPACFLVGTYQDQLALTLTSGYAAEKLPPGIEQCLMEYATHLYEHREIFVNSGTDVVPAWIMDSFATWWVPRA